MSRHEGMRSPAPKTTAYQIAELLKRNGPMTPTAIFSVIEYSGKAWSRRELLQKWIDNGWFEKRDQEIALTEFAFTYLDGAPVKPLKAEPIGIPATGCTFNMLTRPPYKTPRTYRREGPAWAQRPAGFGFVTIAGVAL